MSQCHYDFYWCKPMVWVSVPENFRVIRGKEIPVPGINDTSLTVRSRIEAFTSRVSERNLWLRGLEEISHAEQKKRIIVKHLLLFLPPSRPIG
ncbi:hypothetical protein RRG08_047786 [Elysia crispata]|uniref:Uncharacterized protein n=1 Tax=Elysia crispata TaxID=231223 RepID=A0AAE0Y2S2_9GAST|nr:hypothetical protein RRG08_047786 [Elysia crispata]